MKKKLLIIIIPIAIAVSILISFMIITRPVAEKNNIHTYPVDTYRREEISDAEYKQISEEIILELEKSFGKEDEFIVTDIEKGTLKIGDVATPQPYQKVIVYSKFLDDTFDGEPYSYISRLLHKYEKDIINKLKQINNNLSVSMIIGGKGAVTKTDYGYIPKLKDIPIEEYEMILYYEDINASKDINTFMKIFQTDIKEAYNLILKEDSSYQDKDFRIDCILDNTASTYTKIIAIINPIDKTITLEGIDINMPETIDWNEIF